MKSIIYQFNHALQELKKRPIANLVAVGTVSLALLLAGLIFLASQVVGYIENNWGNGALVAVYLENNLSQTKIDQIKNRLNKMEGISSIEYISPAQARKKLIKGLQKDASVIRKIENNFYPQSLEIVIKGEKSLVSTPQEKIKKRDGLVTGITDIRDVQKWNRKVGNIIHILTFIGIIVMSIVLFASGYVIMSTIRLNIENKKEEMQIIKLMGASPGFIKGPILIHGIIQGLLGAVIAFFLLWGFSIFIFPFLSILVGFSLPASGIPFFFSYNQVIIGLGLDGLTGFIAGQAALSTVKI
jgi:cell division transport system permease protein